MEEGREMEQSDRRVISASCFRVLSLQPEIQNDEEVLKPILEELEVLRLSCALGALPNVDAKDFEYEDLEAKDFDDDLVHCLRSEVFGGDEEDQTNRPQVRVVGVFGKQEQVKGHLQSIGAWDQDMEAHLQLRDIGMYAVMLPLRESSDCKTIAVFSWLLDEFFEPARLRETPTYLLRLLTCLTNDVTCCLSAEDKAFLEAQMLGGGHDGGGDDWNAYSVAFRVEQQQDQRDDVRAVHVQDVPLPRMDAEQVEISLLRGCYPALMTMSESTNSIAWKKSKKTFQEAPAFARWISERVEKYEVHASQGKWSDAMVEAVLRHCGEWPQRRLDELQQEFERRAAEMTDLANLVGEEIFLQETYLAPLRLAADTIFRVESMAEDFVVQEATNKVEFCLSVLRADASFGLPDQLVTRLRLPIRLPLVMKEFFELFRNQRDEELGSLLQLTPSLEYHELFPARFMSRLFGYMSNLLPLPRRRTNIGELDAFRGRMRIPLDTMKAVWQAEVWSVVHQYASHVTRVNANERRARMSEVHKAEVAAAVEGALRDLQAKWAAPSGGRMSLHVDVHPAKRGSVRCTVCEQVCAPRRTKLQVWGIHGRRGQNPTVTPDGTFTPMRETHLEEKEAVLKAFVIQRQSILVVSSTCEGTIVRRVDFPVHRRGRSDATSKILKRLGRRVALCDFNAEERKLVLVGFEGATTVFRIREDLSAMEAMRTFNVGILTSLELPLRDIVFSDGVLHMVDQVGAVQTLNTRNLQTSRKQRLVEGSCEMAVRSQLFRVLDGAILGWVNGEPDSPVTRFQFFAAEDMRVLPRSVDQELLCTGGHMECATFDGDLYVVDDATKAMHKYHLEATLKSDSYRIRKLGFRSNEAQDSLRSAASPQREVSDHWLWVFYHLREKFPVSGELFRDEFEQGPSSLALTFVCSSDDRSRDLAAACDKLLSCTSQKLLLLNKPLGGVDFATGGSRMFSGTHVGSAAVAYYSTIAPLSVNALLRELITFVPVQLCRAEFNTLTLMNDGQPTTHVRSEDEESGLHATDIARRLRFGLLSPLLLSWRGRCVVVTSMGKQSTGKSYFLNHLTGTSFAISGARCTDGAWMSVRVLPSRVLLVVMDFEGLGSLERSEQEDVFLSVLNASVSLLTIFRMEMRFDKSIDDLFARFQKGSQLIKRDAQLFRGKLYMSVKDVNPDDQHGVVGEFVTKFERLLGANKERNFLTDLYAGQVDINCSPPLGTVGYYRSLSSVKDQIEKGLCTDRNAGFPSGKAFLDCIRLLLAKVAILDWTSLDETAMKFKVAELLEKLPSALRFGSVVARMEDIGESSTRWLSAKEPLVDERSGLVVIVATEEVFAANPLLAGMWRELLVTVPFDQVDDETIDFGLVTVSDMSRIQAASGSLQSLFRIYAELLGVDSLEVRLLKKSTQLSFDLFLSFLVRRRCLRVRKWCRSVFGDRVPESWPVSELQAVDSLHTTLVRCQNSCSSCQLGCMKACAHAANGDEVHDCGTSHACAGTCTYCAQDTEGGLADCSKRAGHDGYCECFDGDHTCKKPCLWSQAGNCGKLCAMKAGHDDGQEHRCSVGLHKCGEPCAAQNCSRPCVLDIAVPHSAHTCDVDRCLVPVLGQNNINAIIS